MDDADYADPDANELGVLAHAGFEPKCRYAGPTHWLLLEDELFVTLPFAERSVFVSVVLREIDPSGCITVTFTFSRVVDRPSSNFVVVVSVSLTVLIPSLPSSVSRIKE